MDAARIWTPRVVAATAFCLYALLVPAGPYWLDSGELAAAAYRLGSPHPTGFPLYCLLGKAASMVPVGEIAFRINLLSAGCAALAVLWIGRLVCESAREDLPAIIGAGAAGATLSLSLVFMRQATVAEVYAPGAALIAGALLLIDRVARGGDARWGLALAVVAGLGVAVHITFAILGLPVIALFCRRLYHGARWPLIAPLLGILVAAGLYAYLPVRSATLRTGGVDWGHPRTAAALASHVSAERVRAAYGAEMRSDNPDAVREHARTVATEVADSVGPFALLGALGGLLWLFRHRRSRWLAAAVATLMAGDAVYSIWINPMGLPDLQNTIPLAMGLCLAAGVGVAWLARHVGRAGPYVGGVACVVLIVPPALLSLSMVQPAAAGDGARAWSEAALAQAPPRSVALVQNDSTAAGLMYLGAVEQARPDVAALVRQHLWDTGTVRAVLAASGLAVDIGVDSSAGASPAEASLALVAGSGRPILWEIGVDAPPPGTALVAGVPLARLVSPADQARLAAPDTGDTDHAAGAGSTGDARADLRAALGRLAVLSAGPGARDRAALRVHASALTSLGRLAIGRGDLELAEVFFGLAIQVRPAHVPAWINRGTVAARRGDLAQAVAHTEHALALEPTRITALVNAARYHLQLGHDAPARGYIDRALAAAPRRADVWALAALVDLRAKNPARAQQRLDRALTLDPRDPDALDLIRQLQARSRD